MSYPQDLSYGVDTRVVLVGTTMCPHDPKKLPELPHVKRNILSLARIFVDPEIIGLPNESIVTIIDCEHTSEILTEIAKSAKAATDTLIVYYAGHGLLGDLTTSLYLVTKNTTSEDKSFNAVRITDVKRAIQTSAARKRILILDCCYSGRAFEGGMGMGSTEDEVGAAIDVSGTYGIAAVPGDYKALAPGGAVYTKFTQALVDVLEQGIDRAGQVLTLDEVFSAVRAVLDREAMPLPQRNNSNEAGNFKLVKNQYPKRIQREIAQRKAAAERQAAAARAEREAAAERQAAAGRAEREAAAQRQAAAGRAEREAAAQRQAAAGRAEREAAAQRQAAAGRAEREAAAQRQAAAGRAEREAAAQRQAAAGRAEREAAAQRQAAAGRAEREAAAERQAAAGRAEREAAAERQAAAGRAQGKADAERRPNRSTYKSPSDEPTESRKDDLDLPQLLIGASFVPVVAWIIAIVIEWTIVKEVVIRPRKGASEPGLLLLFLDPFGYDLGIWSYILVGTTVLCGSIAVLLIISGIIWAAIKAALHRHTA